MSAPTAQLVVFDFDWSMVDQDTDRWVLEVLSTPLRRKLQTIKAGGSQCTPDVVAECMVELHKEGKTREEILAALRILPFHPAMKRAVTALQQRDPHTQFLCLSNSNTVYINTILAHHNLTSLFSEIITNPASWDSTHPDLLHVGRRLPGTAPPHGCTTGCLVNMCKGAELDAYVGAHGGWDALRRVVYIGDGGNDFCPLLRMRAQDLALVRKDMELHARIKNEAKDAGLKCQVKYWTGAWEVDEYFAEL